MKKEIKWINCAKMIAIVAVLIDHTVGVLYSNVQIQRLSYFSVDLFVILSGITLYKSNERRKQTFWERSRKIVFAYLIASLLYVLVVKKGMDLPLYLLCITHFNASGPFYYVLLYLQLLLINRIMFVLLKKSTWKQDIIMFAGVVAVSWLSTNYTNILNVYGGGGRLFGGTFLILFYLGMLISKYDFLRCKSNKEYFITLLASVVMFVLWAIFVQYNQFRIEVILSLGNGINPPGVTYMLLSLIVLFFIYAFFMLMDSNTYLEKIVDFCAWIGSHSLYIFLYHRLFLDFFLVPYMIIDNRWVKRIIYAGVMVFGSILFSICFKFIGKCMEQFRQRLMAQFTKNEEV